MPSPPSRPDRQKRSAKTRERILGVIARAIDEETLQALTVHDIAKAAGCSIGAFYGRFPDKEAALDALAARRREAFLSALKALNARATDLESWAQAACALALDHALANRALLARAPRGPDGATLFAQGRLAERDLVDAIARLLRERFALPLASAEAANRAMAALALIGAMARDSAIHSPALAGRPQTRDWLAEETARAISAYLRAPARVA